MSLLHAWRNAPLRIVDTSTLHRTMHPAIEFRLYATNKGTIDSVVARWYPTNIRTARAFLKAFKGEDSWVMLAQLEELLALEGLEDFAEEIRLAFTQQLRVTPDEPLGRHVADSRRARLADRIWFALCVLGIATIITAAILTWLFQ